MKAKHVLPLMLLGYCFCLSAQAQINIDAYKSFRQQVENIEYDGLNSLYARPFETYCKGYNETPDFSDVLYFDSVKTKYSLTSDELSLLKQNHFVVSERLSHESFNAALTDIFNKDLPVFISSDAILHVLHLSYSRILKEMEKGLMSSNLEGYLKEFYDDVPTLVSKYHDKGIDESLQDLDLYATVAYSLITGKEQPVRIASVEMYDQVMNSIKSETATDISLFCSKKRTRFIDFSQFKVRGHYVYTENEKNQGLKSLEPYFKTMMWLGRTDLYLTTPETTEPTWEKDEIRRMNITTFLLNEIHQKCVNKDLFQVNEKIINYLVGESDNITIDEFNNFLFSQSIISADALLSDSIYDRYYQGLLENEDFKQKIMGAMFLVDPNASEPAELPVSFYISGQRFIIDSYVLANVVFDRVIFNGKSEWRLMPDPLDALFALGNNDAAYFLEEDINTYHYASNLANMRYLIDNKDEDFWNVSLYNVWLNSIRKLNPVENDQDYPFFMRTSAWHQQKMNTQLASWTQLRHDNLLYAKPSYTGGTMCSYPFSYVEPYPEFYENLSLFCKNIGQFLSQLPSVSYELSKTIQFFPKFASVMDKLKILAEKEIQNQPFSESENDWLKSMLVKTIRPECGQPPYTGWFFDLVFDLDDFKKPGYLTVDLHTQPTDSLSAMVGKVLHTGIGEVNLGVFMIKPSGMNEYVAFTGPFMSYYEKITTGFERMTDQDWEQIVDLGTLPDRPEWTRSYLADKFGTSFADVEELPYRFLVSNGEIKNQINTNLIRFYPNPVAVELTIENVDIHDDCLKYSVFNCFGKKVFTGVISSKQKIDFSSCPKGLYLLKVETVGKHSTVKILKE